MKMDLELLRSVLGDSRTHITVAVVQKVEVLLDLSAARVQCLTMPEELEVVATVAWGACSQSGGVFLLPSVQDLVLLTYEEQGEPYVVARLSGKEDKLPRQTQDGHLVVQAPSGKKTYVGSGESVYVGKGGLADPTEPVPLGNVLADCLNALFEKFDGLLDKLIAGPVGMGNLGSPVPTYPALITDLTTIKADLATQKAQYLSTTATNILSQTVFTER